MIKYAFIFLLLTPPQLSPRQAAPNANTEPSSCLSTELNEYDAEILLYMLPASVTSRGNGRKIGWELQDGPKLNQKDFFSFYLYDVSAPANSSPTIGYFAINKHTGEVWDMSRAESVESEDLSAVQKILRRGHCVDEKILKAYASRRPDILNSK
jgi:hypothetical protein